MVRPKTDVELAGELEQIATAAAERLRALVAGDAEREVELQRRVGEAASLGIAAGLSPAAIADAEQVGQARAREELGPELLRAGGAGRTPQARGRARVRGGDRPGWAAWACASRLGGRGASGARNGARIIARSQAASGQRAPAATSATGTRLRSSRQTGLR